MVEYTYCSLILYSVCVCMLLSVCLCKLVYCSMGALRLTIKSFFCLIFAEKKDEKFFFVIVFEFVINFSLLFLRNCF